MFKQRRFLKKNHTQIKAAYLKDKTPPAYPTHMGNIKTYRHLNLGMGAQKNLAYIRLMQERAFQEGNLNAEIRLQEMFLKCAKENTNITPKQIIEDIQKIVSTRSAVFYRAFRKKRLHALFRIQTFSNFTEYLSIFIAPSCKIFSNPPSPSDGFLNCKILFSVMAYPFF